MYTLTKEQKLANLEETLKFKEKKLKNLSEEVILLKKKIQKFQSSIEPVHREEAKEGGRIKTSTNLSIIPAATRDQYEYDPTAPTFEEILTMRR
jgi:uncharacterized coiled-coil protein SlyX